MQYDELRTRRSAIASEDGSGAVLRLTTLVGVRFGLFWETETRVTTCVSQPTLDSCLTYKTLRTTSILMRTMVLPRVQIIRSTI